MNTGAALAAHETVNAAVAAKRLKRLITRMKNSPSCYGFMQSLSTVVETNALSGNPPMRIPAALASAWGVQITARLEVAIMVQKPSFASYR